MTGELDAEEMGRQLEELIKQVDASFARMCEYINDWHDVPPEYDTEPVLFHKGWEIAIRRVQHILPNKDILSRVPEFLETYREALRLVARVRAEPDEGMVEKIARRVLDPVQMSGSGRSYWMEKFYAAIAVYRAAVIEEGVR